MDKLLIAAKVPKPKSKGTMDVFIENTHTLNVMPNNLTRRPERDSSKEVQRFREVTVLNVLWL